MSKLFIVYYKASFNPVLHPDIRDVAIVRARDEKAVEKNLYAYLLNQTKSVDKIEISLIKEYKGSVFTRKFGHIDD